MGVMLELQEPWGNPLDWMVLVPAKCGRCSGYLGPADLSDTNKKLVMSVIEGIEKTASLVRMEQHDDSPVEI